MGVFLERVWVNGNESRNPISNFQIWEFDSVESMVIRPSRLRCFIRSSRSYIRPSRPGFCNSVESILTRSSENLSVCFSLLNLFDILIRSLFRLIGMTKDRKEK